LRETFGRRAEEKGYRDKKRQKAKEFGLRTNRRKNARQKLRAVKNIMRIKLV
jgi:hypothetical protein